MANYLITGASSGIGEEMARQAVGRGHKVYGLARRTERLGALAKELGDGFAPVECDVTDADKVKEVCYGLPELPDIVILNAGVWGFDNRERFDISVHKRIMETNYFGALSFVDVLFQRFSERGYGTFVAIASLAGYRGLPGTGAYSASKAALSVAVESMRLTYRKENIAFLTVHPGFIDTAMTRHETHPMPFLWTAPKAAGYILDGIERGKLNINFPWPLWILTTIARLLPPRIYRAIMRG